MAAASRPEAENLQTKTNCGFHRVSVLMILHLFPFHCDCTPVCVCLPFQLRFLFFFSFTFFLLRFHVYVWPLQINHKYPERRLLVAEACGALAPYLPVSLYGAQSSKRDGFGLLFFCFLRKNRTSPFLFSEGNP